MNDGDLMTVGNEVGHGMRTGVENLRAFKSRSTKLDNVLHSRPSASPQP